MQGIIKLIPIENPVKDIQVVVYKDGKKRIAIISSLSLQKGFLHVRLLKKNLQVVYCESLYTSCNETFTVVIEYQQLSGNFNSVGQLPLHPEDWKKALLLIGKEVEFIVDETNSTMYDETYTAKLILPKQEERTYTRQDMENVFYFGRRLKTSVLSDKTLSEHLKEWFDENYPHQKD